VSPKGQLLGHYRLQDLVLAAAALLVAGLATVISRLPQKERRAAIGVTLALVTTSAVFLALDVSYAMFFLGAWQPNYWLDRAHISRVHNISDPELGFVRKANITWGTLRYRTDEQGFRNPPGIKAADLVFIGDSYTEAAGVPEHATFAALAARLTGLRAVNLGRGAYGPQQELIVLRRFGLKYRPRYVVWQLFAGNDLSDAEEYKSWRDGLARNASVTERYSANSVAWSCLKRLLRVPENRGPAVRIRHSDGSVTSTTARYPFRPLGGGSSIGVLEMKRALAEGAALCARSGSNLVVVFIPTMVQVHRRDIIFERPQDRQQYLPDEPDAAGEFGRAIDAVCAEARCSFINALDGLRRAAREHSAPLYIPADEHLTPAGHQAVAAMITDAISQSHRISSMRVRTSGADGR
jgi:hypothetical protein